MNYEQMRLECVRLAVQANATECSVTELAERIWAFVNGPYPVPYHERHGGIDGTSKGSTPDLPLATLATGSGGASAPQH